MNDQELKQFDILPLMRSYYPYTDDETLIKMATERIIRVERTNERAMICDDESEEVALSEPPVYIFYTKQEAHDYAQLLSPEFVSLLKDGQVESFTINIINNLSPFKNSFMDNIAVKLINHFAGSDNEKG